MHAHALFNNNKVRILIAGFETYVMVDSGATISGIDDNFFRRICNNSRMKLDKGTHKKCLLANGTHVLLDKRVDLPMKFNSITIEAELYILPMNHVSIIIRCDLLDLLNASIEFRTKQVLKNMSKPKNIFFRQNTLG